MTRRAFTAALGQAILELPPPPADVRIPYGADPNQFGDLRIPQGKGPHPAVIFLHGGYWHAAYDLRHAGHLCAALTAAGFATWSLEYRRIGQSGGGWPGTLDDVRAGARHLAKLVQRYNLDLRKVVAAGHSAGGQLALWLAAQRAADLRRVVALAAVSDLRQAYRLQLSDRVVEKFLGGTPEQVPQRYQAASPIELLPIPIEQRLLHGTADGVVPYAMSVAFAAKSKNATLVPLAGAGHFELIDPRSKQWPAVQKQITE